MKLLVFLILLSFTSQAKLISGYKTEGLCVRLPKVDLKTPKNYCVGIFAHELNFPRHMITIGDDLIVVDKGSDLFDKNEKGMGSIILYEKNQHKFEKKILLKNLFSPSGIAKGPRDYIFFATPKSLYRFKLSAPEKSLTPVVKDLGYNKDNWHFMSSVYVFEDKLYLSLGSATDHCEKKLDKKGECTDTRGDLREYTLDKRGNISSTYKVVAKGVRNIMAMAENPATSEIFFADNGWDSITPKNSNFDPQLIPQDELNILRPGAHYGFPYCYGLNNQTPGFNKVCKEFEQPYKLLPPHSAPLSMVFQKGDLIIAYHGHGKNGGRVVKFSPGKDGRPFGPEKNLISNWSEGHSLKVQTGRPMGLAKSSDGGLYISDDWSGVIFKFQKELEIK